MLSDAEIINTVLNLIITGMPSIPGEIKAIEMDNLVLNLIITGMPSILRCSRWN